MNIKDKISNVIRKEAEAIQAINVTDEFEDAVNILNDCKGKVVATGIGKAGFIAHKFAATLSSTGTPAVYIHPAEAGHGDLGVLNPEDCIVAFSTSGKSNEVIEMLEIARHLGVETVIGITSHPDSLLRELSETILDMGPDIEEPCPLKLTPSATTAVMLAISDALALTLMELKGFTKEQYGMRHHKGYLGSITRKKPDYES
ncbi:MAG: SIS domain-containing protein [Pseudomonadales bacterium]|nr:SIS domain-containing protein [Pseudomonadales bacterium]